MISRYKPLPASLKAVCWINLVGAILTLLNLSLAFGTAAAQDLTIGGVSVVLSVLAILGILDRSRFIRMVMLVFSWMGVLALVPTMIILANESARLGLAILVPLTVYVVTIWGMVDAEAKAYFGIGWVGE